MKGIQAIKEIGNKILMMNPDQVVRFLLLRDVIKVSVEERRFNDAKKALNDSFPVKELEKEQWSDGSWGAFHSRNTKRKQKIPTTEIGVERALNLGLDLSHPILQRAESYIVGILEGRIPFPDSYEKNDRWNLGMNLFLCSTLSLLNHDHPLLDKWRKLWLEILKRTFRSGSYNEDDEIKAHNELTGATVKGSYLVLNSRYHLILLGSKRGFLSEHLENLFIQWIWNLKKGIGYIEVPLSTTPPLDKPSLIERWFKSHELVSLFYPKTWSRLISSHINWIWENSLEDSFWDFGPRIARSYYFPLSNNWQIRRNRKIDWTTRVLILLRRYYDATEDDH